MPQRSVFCIAPGLSQARGILAVLREEGFPGADVSTVHLAGIAGAKQPPGRGAGGAAEWIAGMGPVSVDGSGPLIAGGPIAAALGGKVVGGLAAGLVGFGLPQLEAARYAVGIGRGQVLVSIRTGNSDRSDRAREIFAAASAEQIRTLLIVPTPPGLYWRSRRGAGTAAA